MAYLMTMKGRHWILLLIILGLAVTACQEDAPTAALPECNPVPVEEPHLPKIVGSISYEGLGEAHGPVHSLNVVGDRLYLGLGDSFGIVDISDTSDPHLLGSLSLKRSAWEGFSNFSVREGLAYLTWDEIDYTIDLSDPTEPVLVRCRSAVPWPAATGAFRERYDIEIYNRGIRITERRPKNLSPIEVATYEETTGSTLSWTQPAGQPLPLPALEEGSPMTAKAVTFDDRYLYLVNVLAGSPFNCCGRLTILDLDNPEEPKQMSTTALPGNLEPLEMKVSDDLLIIRFEDPAAGTMTRILYDISSKRRPVELQTIPGYTMPAVYDSFIYDPNQGDINIWQLGRGKRLEQVGNIVLPGLDPIFYQVEKRLAVVGDKLYIGTDQGLTIFNNKDPEHPVISSQLAFPALPVVLRLALENGRLAAIDWETATSTRLTLSQVTDFSAMPFPPHQPLSAPGYFLDIDLSNGYVFGLSLEPGAQGSSTRVVMVDPNAGESQPPAEITLSDIETTRFAAAYPYVYLLDLTPEKDSLVILDFSDPARPVPAGNIEIEHVNYQDMAVWEDSLYIGSTGSNGGVWRFDISDGERPNLVEKLPFELIQTLTVGDGYLIGINLTGQLQVVQLKPDRGGVTIGLYNIERRSITDVAYGDGVVYLGLGMRGVATVILDLEGKGLEQ